MFNTLIIKWAAAALLAAAFSAGIYSGYSHIKQIGYQEAETKYTLVIKQYEDNLNKSIAIIETNSTTLVTESRDTSAVLAKDISTIVRNTKTKPLTIVKNGECTPSQTFSDSFVELNKRVNQSIKDTQK